ncbi:hypothetical protein RB195_017061 [Necator americanus]
MKILDSAEVEAVEDALDIQDVFTQYVRVVRELYGNFTTEISPFYNEYHHQATFENAMRKLEYDDKGVKVDGRQQHHLRFADDIVLITSSVSQAE